MSIFQKRLKVLRNAPVQVSCVLFLMAAAVALLWFNSINSVQAVSATTAQVRFVGDYRIGIGEWQPITEAEHISSTKGDVTLRGIFQVYTPDGEYISPLWAGVPVAFYTDHISVTIYEGDKPPYIFDHENPLYGISACGVDWTAYTFTEDVTEPIEILIHNPHRFGNENAVDDLISGFSIWHNIDFEKSQMDKGKTQQIIGVCYVIVSLVLFGTAAFCTLLHVPNSRIIWLLGTVILSAGVYWTYHAPVVSFWSDSVANNTTFLGFSMMFYMLFVCILITHFLQNTKWISEIITIAAGFLDIMYFLLPILTGILFYDTWWIWIITQTITNVVLLYCLLRDFGAANNENRFVYGGMALLLIAFEADAIATLLGYWQGGFISKHVFALLFAAALFIVLRIIPSSINAASKAKELELQRSRLEAEKSILEAELKESRISIMLSQIQPHFIYNTLGTIERMCLKDSKKAFELVRNFSLYLRGNFSKLDSVTPIRFADELQHVEYYVSIEKVRFPDMCIEYSLETTDFVLPALTVQPLVENAIKHGLMRLEKGGSVIIRTYETQTHFCVEVKDDGVGFDTNLPVDEKKHVGIHNIRGRLKAMVNGELNIESAPGAGTKATIMIPKEDIA